MNRKELAKKIYNISNIKGTFKLRSGIEDNEYFDKYLFESDPKLLYEICLALSPLIFKNVDILAGLEMGGIPIAIVLSQITDIPTIFVRKKPKIYGTCKIVEGREIKNRKIAIIEDVVTTGGQILESTKELEKLEATIIQIICVIDREAGGKENLYKSGLKFCPLFNITELSF